MRDLGIKLEEIITDQLRTEGVDLVELVPVPKNGDRLIQLQTIEEVLEHFDASTEEVQGYFVKIRKSRPVNREENEILEGCNEDGPALWERASSSSPLKPSLDGIFLPNGKYNTPYLFKNAQLLFNAGDYSLARNVYQTILKSGEQSAKALYGLGRCFEQENRVEEALSSYEESIAYHPAGDTYNRLAGLLIRSKKDLRAAELLEAALTLKGLSIAERLEMHKASGNCWLRCEKLEKAEKHYHQAIEIEPLADDVHANLGALYLKQGKISEAKKHFQKASTVNAKNDKALSGMGMCFISEGDKKQGYDYLAKSLHININNPSAVYNLIKCAYDIKCYATAASILTSYIDCSPINANLLYSLAGLHFHLGRMEEARNTAKKVIELQPQHLGANELIRMIDRYTGPAQ